MDLKKIEARFEEHLKSVDELIGFDKIILDVCISHIEDLNEKLKNGPFKIDNPHYLAENTLQVIKNIRTNNSLERNYKSMYNSCLVLQVSYFTSTINDIFKYVFHTLTTNDTLPKIEEDLKFTIQDIKILTLNPKANLGDLLLRKKDISFQNMESIISAFQKYFEISIQKNSQCNTIVLAQASKNAIVHSLAKADNSFFDQINSATPRDIKKQITLGEKIQYSNSELEFVKLSMLVFIGNLCDLIKDKYNIK